MTPDRATWLSATPVCNLGRYIIQGQHGQQKGRCPGRLRWLHADQMWVCPECGVRHAAAWIARRAHNTDLADAA